MHDYVVVGAGSAGCVLAARLSEDPDTRVLLLEAGPPDKKTEIHVPAAFAKLFKTEHDWAYETVAQPPLDGRRLFWPRGRTLGGSSSINAQMWVRGNRADYDHWAELGNPGWSFRDVLPYFRRSEHHERGPAPHRGVDGPLNISDLRDPNPTTDAFVQAAVEAGVPRSHDVNGDEQDGVDYTQVNQKRGRRWSAADGYLKPTRRRRNLTVRTGARATRVLLDGRRAAGVEFVHDGRAETAMAAREVILAGGAINSPQLLMLSGFGPAAQLSAHGVEVVRDLPGVGQNLQDHLVVAMIVTSPAPVTLFAAETFRNLVKFLVRRKGMLTSNVGEACAFVRTKPGLSAPDLELVFAPVPFIDHGLVAPTGHGLTIGAVALQPRSVGELTLHSADPLDPVDLDPRCLSDSEGEDLRVLVEGLRLARRIFDAPALAPYVGDPLEPLTRVDTDESLAAHVREQAETLYHPVGTCKMGVDEMAVVDAELRVHGAESLRVVDASVMPTIVRGHTHAPTVMIAEKAADLIRTGA
ncbi:MAG: GMC family oxidoreductase [Actinomycetota bacterium]